MKELSEMSLQELWELFPIFLTEHNPLWKEWYCEEEVLLQVALKNIEQKRISHIGSTALKNIKSKPTIDILVEVPKESDIKNAKDIIVNYSYRCMSESDRRISFCKGYTPKGFEEKVFHLHLRLWGDNDELYFRDYLMENAAVSKSYEVLKIQLWKKFPNDRDAYTNSKGDFINKYTKQAREKYKNKYK